jgi:hypothetical protein
MLVVKAGATMATQDLAAVVTLMVEETPTEAEATPAIEEVAAEASKIAAAEVVANVVVAIKAVVMTTKAVRTTMVAVAGATTIAMTMVATGDRAVPHPATKIVVPKVELPNTLVTEAVVLVAVVPEAVATMVTLRTVRGPALTQLLLPSRTLVSQEGVSPAVLPSTRQSRLRVSPTQSSSATLPRKPPTLNCPRSSETLT